MEILENTQIFYNIVVVLPTFWWHIADYLPRKSGSGVVAYVHLLIGQQVVAHLLRLIWQQPVAKLSKDDGQQPVVQISEEAFFSVPWGHHLYIISQCKDVNRAVFYLKKTVENGWSRAILLNFLDTNLYERQGKAVNNFTRLLANPQSELAAQTLKDPYNFDFLTLDGEHFLNLLLSDIRQHTC